ncbi:MAG: hypothetical protein AB1847_22940 [bacterium]
MRLLLPNSSDKKLIYTFIIFSLTFFAVAMIALFIVIYASDADEIFQKDQRPSTNRVEREVRFSPIQWTYSSVITKTDERPYSMKR